MRVVQAAEQTYWRFARNRFELNGALLDRLRADIKPPTRLAVVFVPGRADTSEDQARRSFLRDWCQRNTTPYLDLTETMTAAGVDSLHIPGNYHWNDRGHEVAGTAIQGFLIDSGSIRYAGSARADARRANAGSPARANAGFRLALTPALGSR